MGSDGHEEGMEAVDLGCELRMVGVRVAVGMKYINLYCCMSTLHM